MLCSRKPVYFNKTSIDRRINNGSGGGNAASKGNDAMDLNINEKIEKFQNQLKNEFVYRIPLRYFTLLGKINFPLKTDFRINCHLEADLKKLSESKKLYNPTDTIPRTLDAKILFIKTTFIRYKQILLDKNLRHYLETIIVSKKILHMGVQKTPIQKTYEIAGSSDSINIYFLGSNRQFDWLEISLMFDKSDKHTSLNDSYNAELAAKYIKSVKL